MNKTGLILIMCFAAFSANFAGGKHRHKSVKNLEKSKKYIKYAENYEAQAEKAEKQGKSKLANALQKCAEAKRIMAEAYKSGDYEKLKRGQKVYSYARKLRDSAKHSYKKHKEKHYDKSKKQIKHHKNKKDNELNDAKI